MRVCVLTVGRSAFSQPLYGKEAASLQRAGNAVTIIAPCLASEDPADPTTNPLGIRVVPLMRMGWGTRREKLQALPRLLRLALRERADVYQAMELQSLLVGAIVKLLTRARLVYDAREHYPLAIAVNSRRGPVATRLIYAVFWLLEALLIRLFVDHAFAVDRGCLERFQRFGRPASLLTNYPRLTFAPAELPPREERPADRPFHLLYTGFTRRRVAVVETIQAVALLRDAGIPVQATFLGLVDDEPFVRECREAIAALGVQDSVRLVGRVGPEEVRRYLAEADCGSLLYHPTPYTEYVTHPVKLFEYMAWGLPVICSNLPNMSRFVRDGEYGLVVDPRDPADIAAAITRLARDPSLAARFSANGRRAFLERHHWEVLEPGYVGVFAQLAPDEPRSGPAGVERAESGALPSD